MSSDGKTPLGCTVCRIGSSFHMVPAIWWDEINCMRHSIDISLKFPRVTTKPIEDNDIDDLLQNSENVQHLYRFCKYLTLSNL